LAIHFHEKEASAAIKNKTLLKKWLTELIVLEQAEPGQINIIFTSDDQLLELNRKYLSKETLTDIITFDYVDNEVIGGDLFISIPRVRENADKFSVSYKNELKRVIVHGILHLLGYDDKNEKQKSRMKQMENKYLVGSPEI
jgi:rRNA maturation RNase YbeY